MSDWDEPDMLWDQIPFVAFDTETTGLGKEDRIIQIAFASFFGDELRTKKWYVYPGRGIPMEATRIHGITDDMVRDAPMFEDILEEVLVELRRAPWVAHNLRFDAGMLAKEIPEERWPTGMPTLCTLDYARKHHPQTKLRRGHKLADLANVFAEDYSTGAMHDAQYDANLLANITHRMMRGLVVGTTMTKMSEGWLK